MRIRAAASMLTIVGGVGLACGGGQEAPADPRPSPSAPASATAPVAAKPPVDTSQEWVRVLAANARAVELEIRFSGDTDCAYEGLAPFEGRLIQVHWRDGLVEDFPIQPPAFEYSDSLPLGYEMGACATAADSERARQRLSSVLAEAELVPSDIDAWYPIEGWPQLSSSVKLSGGQVLSDSAVSLPDGILRPYEAMVASLDEESVEPLLRLLAVDGVAVGGWYGTRSRLGGPMGSPFTLPIGVATLGNLAVGLFAHGWGGEGERISVVLFDLAHPEPLSALRVAGRREIHHLELQALNLPRRLVAYRELVLGEGRCEYPGVVDPAAGVILGIYNVVNHSDEHWVIYDPPAPGEPCTPPEVSSERLAAAKARSKALGLDRVTGGLPACHSLQTDTPLSVELLGKTHTVRYGQNGKTNRFEATWDGVSVPYKHGPATADDMQVCVDRGWVLMASRHAQGFWSPGLPFEPATLK